MLGGFHINLSSILVQTENRSLQFFVRDASTDWVLSQKICDSWETSILFIIIEETYFLFSFTRRLIKSTFFLVALFGLHYILFVFLPVEVSSSVFKIWTFAELALSSTQVNKVHV